MVGTKKELLGQLEQVLPDNDDLIGLTYWSRGDIEDVCEDAEIDPEKFINNYEILDRLMDNVSTTDDLWDLITNED